VVYSVVVGRRLPCSGVRDRWRDGTTTEAIYFCVGIGEGAVERPVIVTQSINHKDSSLGSSFDVVVCWAEKDSTER
jgi:hypothetical protein